MTQLALVGIALLVTAGCVAVLLVLIIREVRTIHRARQPGNLPRMTFVVIVGGNAAPIVQLRDEIAQLDPKVYDIVVVRTSKAVTPKQVIAMFATISQKLYVYSPRNVYTYTDYIAKAYARGRKGECVLSVDARSTFTPGVISGIDYTALAEYNAVHIKPGGNSVGVIGAATILIESFSRLYRYALSGGKKAKAIQPGEVYAFSARSIPSKQPILASGTTTSKPLTRSVGWEYATVSVSWVRWLVFVICIVSLGLLAAAAINGSGLETFTFVWVAASVVGCCVVLLDRELSWGSRLTVLACGGFIPLLLVLVVPLDIRTRQIHFN